MKLNNSLIAFISPMCMHLPLHRSILHNMPLFSFYFSTFQLSSYLCTKNLNKWSMKLGIPWYDRTKMSAFNVGWMKFCDQASTAPGLSALLYDLAENDDNGSAELPMPQSFLMHKLEERRSLVFRDLEWWVSVNVQSGIWPSGSALARRRKN